MCQSFVFTFGLNERKHRVIRQRFRCYRAAFPPHSARRRAKHEKATDPIRAAKHISAQTKQFGSSAQSAARTDTHSSRPVHAHELMESSVSAPSRWDSSAFRCNNAHPKTVQKRVTTLFLVARSQGGKYTHACRARTRARAHPPRSRPSEPEREGERLVSGQDFGTLLDRFTVWFGCARCISERPRAEEGRKEKNQRRSGYKKRHFHSNSYSD